MHLLLLLVVTATLVLSLSHSAAALVRRKLAAFPALGRGFAGRSDALA